MADKAELELIIRDPDAGKTPPPPPPGQKPPPGPPPPGPIDPLQFPSDEFLKKIGELKNQQLQQLGAEISARKQSPHLFDDSSPEIAELEQFLRLAKAGIIIQQQALSEPNVPDDYREILESQLAQLRQEEKDLVTELAARKAYERELERRDAELKLKALQEPDRIAALPLERRNYAQMFGTEKEAERFARWQEEQKLAPIDVLDPTKDAISRAAEAKRRQAMDMRVDADARTISPGLFSEGSQAVDSLVNKLKKVQSRILENQAKFADAGIDDELKKVLEAKDATLREAERRLQDELADVKSLEAEERAKASYKRRMEAKHGPGAVEKQQAAGDMQNAGQAMSLAGMQRLGGMVSGGGQIMATAAGAAGPMAAVTGAIMIAQQIKDAVVDGVGKIGDAMADVGRLSGRGAEVAFRDVSFSMIDPVGLNPFIQGLKKATNAADQFTDSLISGAARQSTDFSIAVNQAFATADIRSVTRGLERTPRIERELSELIDARSLRTETGKDLEAELIRIWAPLAVKWERFMTDINVLLVAASPMLKNGIDNTIRLLEAIVSTLPGGADFLRTIQELNKVLAEQERKRRERERKQMQGLLFNPFELIGPDPAGVMNQMRGVQDARGDNARPFQFPAF